MKKIIFTFCLFIVALISKGQNTFVMLSEDFENVDSVNNIASTGSGWADDPIPLHVSGVHSWHCTITNVGDTNIMETVPFNDGFLGLGFITLSFQHIAKVDFFDRCIMEYSTDFGASWTQIDQNPAHGLYTTPQPNALTWASTSSFMAPAYPTWLPTQPTVTPDNTWWKKETFDMSQAWAFAPDIRLRFKMFDNNNNGGAGNYGWNIDDINVIGAYCELDPPVMSQNGAFSGAVYSGGPFTIGYTSTDASGISYGYLVYTVTDSLGNIIKTDSSALSNVGGNTWTGQIDSISLGDTVCYYAYTVDASGCLNYTYVPLNGGCTSFYFGAATGFPYCNDFNQVPDTTWHVVTVSGSAWEQGIPTTPPTNTTYNGAGCWDVDLNNIYQNSTETYLYSPLFAWANYTNVKLSFYQNRAVESGWDGVVLQWDSAGVGNWQDVGTIGDTNATNWYTNTIISNPSAVGAWDGTSAGWEYSDIILYQLNGFQGSSVQFRFMFTSDASVTITGFSIDQFCLKLPQVFDVGVIAINQPQGEVPAGSTASVDVIVKNFGITPMNAGDFNINYSINGVPQGASPFAGATIQPNGTGAFTIPTTFVVPTGSYDLCAWTELASDGDLTNDTLCKSLLGVPTFTPPYCDAFDTIPVYWNGLASINGNTAWVLGPPANGIINTAKSSPNVWITNLNTQYGNNVDAELRSPYFDFSTAPTFNSNVSFWMNRSIQTSSDGLIFEYTTNNGATWTTLGIPGVGTNWYNNPNPGPNFNGPGWDGNSGGWVRCEYPVAIFNGAPSVRFRFHFESDFFGTAEGAAIDNFCVKPPVPDDVGVKRIISPGSQVVAGATVVPTVVIRNYGNNVQTSIPVKYRVNTGGITAGLFTGTLNPGDSVNFNNWAGFVVPSCNFDFDSYTELPGDPDLTNDTAATKSVGVPLYLLPTSGAFCEDFDSMSCWTSEVQSTQGSSVWELGTPNFGATTGAHSPPNSWDVNLSTGYDNNANIFLYTSKYDFTNAVNATMSFWHNWNTENGWDGLRVWVDTGGTGNWWILGTGATDPNGVNWYNKATILSSTGPAWDGNSNGWVKSSHNLDSLSGISEVQFRFQFTSDGSVTLDGHSIDDFCIRTPFPHDIGVSAIIRPGPLEGAGTSLPPQVEIKNYGSNIETSSPITYQIDANPPVTTIWNGSIAPNQVVLVSLDTMIVPAGSFGFCAWTELPGDGDLTNDTLCGSSFGVPVVIPTYADNFDTGSVSFVNVPGTAGAATNWELGSPSFGQTNSTHSAPNCWDVNLAIPYGINDSCFLYTPIFDLTGKFAPVMRFWQNRNLDNFNNAGVHVEYTVNGGTTWSVLGSSNSIPPIGLNWYNSAQIFSAGNEPGWNGSSAGWKFTYLALNTTVFDGSPGLHAQFRFVFNSGFNQVDGYSLDDFELFIPTALTVTPQAIIPVNKLLTPGPQFITAKIRNKGTNVVNTANVTLKIDTTVIVTDAVTFNPALIGATYVAPGGFEMHTFSLPWNASPGIHTVCVYTDSPNGNADQYLLDDTLCTDLSVFDSVTVATGNPYCSDFETGPQWVTLNAVTFAPPNNPGPVTWTLGLPAKACLNSTHSGVKAWSTLLNANYPDRDTSALFTPVFNIDNSKCYKLSFWHKYDTEQFQDGGNVEYSTDSGNTWYLLGFGGEPNWYNSTFVTGLGGNPPRAGFSGTNCTWTQAEHQWQPYSGSTVIFRFRFGSDFSFNKEGWSIDDVCFEEIATCVQEITEVNGLEGLGLGQNYPNPANTATSFDYVLPDHGKVLVELTDIMGHVVMTPVDGMMSEGTHTVTVSLASLAPGIYFYTLKFNDNRLVKKMVITK